MTTAVLGIADDRALGGSMRVIVTRPQSLVAAKAAVDEVIREIDIAASRFREDSELSRLNAMPDKVMKVSPLLANAIETGLRGAALTDGAVDPTIGHALEVTGYDTDFSSVAPQGAALRLVAKRVPGWQAIHFNAAARTVLIPRGVVIDLGATGKALAADLAAAAAARATGGGVLVSLGGDISVAGEAPTGGWLIQVSEDSATAIEDGEETVSISAGGIATSGTTVRRWTRGGVVLHHIIDPATGLPVESPWRTATVAAATCVDANIASTAAIVMGDEAFAWLKIRGLAARLVDREGRVWLVGDWPESANSKLAATLF
ncbi:MAG: FAD:protein FMN transferase [Chloroflexi bacterium]|nr:MAG: FAD:protein FMN transferase [Chloroflexota bacterium]